MVPWLSKPAAIFAFHHKQDTDQNAPLVLDKQLESFNSADRSPARLAQKVLISRGTAIDILVTRVGAASMTKELHPKLA